MGQWWIWLLACVGGAALVTATVSQRRPQRPAARVLKPLPPADGRLWTADWRLIHVGPANDAVTIDHIELWKEPWRPAGMPPVSLPHPQHPDRTHDFEIFDAGARFQSRRFAATELSNGVWGFYVPRSGAVPEEECLSANGSLRYVRRRIGPPDYHSWKITLSDAVTDAVYFEDGSLEFSGIFEQADGTLKLQVTDRYSGALIHIDPRAGVFRLHGAEGEGRPLATLHEGVYEALYANTASSPMNAERLSAEKMVPWYRFLAIVLGVLIAIGLVSYLAGQLLKPVPFAPAPAVLSTPMPTTPSIPGPSGGKR